LDRKIIREKPKESNKSKDSLISSKES